MCRQGGRKVDVRLPGKGNSNSHGARPVHLIVKMVKWIRTSVLSINHSLSNECVGREAGRGATARPSRIPLAASSSIFWYLTSSFVEFEEAGAWLAVSGTRITSLPASAPSAYKRSTASGAKTLPGKENSNSHGARPVHLSITMIMWIRTSRLSVKKRTVGVRVGEERDAVRAEETALEVAGYGRA